MVPFQKSLYSKDTECFFSYGDWLYWKPTAILGGNLNGTATIHNNAGGAPSTANLKPNENRLPYASGFRVGLGYRFKENYLSRPIRPWQIEASYERIYTASHKKATASGYTSLYNTTTIKEVAINGIADGQYIDTSNNNIGGIGWGGNLFDTITQENSYSNFGKIANFLGYNRADLKISWPFWIFDNVILKVGTGASFGYLSEKTSSTYYLKDLPLSTDVQGYYVQSQEATWWGGGLLFTGDISFDIGYGLGIYIDSSAAFMFGRARTKLHFLSTDYNDNTVYFDDYRYQPVVKVASGLSYNKWFGPVQLYSSAGWEFNYWWYGDLMHNDTLQLSGLTARLGVAY